MLRFYGEIKLFAWSLHDIGLRAYTQARNGTESADHGSTILVRSGRVTGQYVVWNLCCCKLGSIHVVWNTWQSHYSYQTDRVGHLVRLPGQVGLRVKSLNPVPSLARVHSLQV